MFMKYRNMGSITDKDIILGIWYIITYMRINIIIDDSFKKKWWEIVQEAAKLNMKIGEYLIKCHEIRKKIENKDKFLEILKKPLSGGVKGLDAIKVSKTMWKN